MSAAHRIDGRPGDRLPSGAAPAIPGGRSGPGGTTRRRSMAARRAGLLATALGAACAASLSGPARAAGGAPADLAALLRDAATQPRLAASRSRVAATEALASQREALPDPVAGLAVQNEGLDRFTYGESPDAFIQISWTQEVPWSGKRRLGGEVARRELDVALARTDSIDRDIRAAILRGWADLYRIDRTAAILRENRALLVTFLDVARARYETGEGLLQNVVKAQTEISKLDAEMEVLAQQRTSTVAMLNRSAGRAAGTPLGLAEGLPDVGEPPDAATILTEAAGSSAAVLEMEAGLSREEARLDLAKRDLKPDWTWGAAWADRGELDPMIMGSIGLRLPVWRRSKQIQAIVQARHEAEAARLDAEAVRLEAAAEAQDAVARAGRAAALSRLYDGGILPQARLALESSSAAYRSGRVEFLTLLDDFQDLLRYQIDLETQRADRVAALADLERLIGRRLVLTPEGSRAAGGLAEGGRP